MADHSHTHSHDVVTHTHEHTHNDEHHSHPIPIRQFLAQRIRMSIRTRQSRMSIRTS
jgi:hypothetical protein